MNKDFKKFLKNPKKVTIDWLERGVVENKKFSNLNKNVYSQIYFALYYVGIPTMIKNQFNTIVLSIKNILLAPSVILHKCYMHVRVTWKMIRAWGRGLPQTIKNTPNNIKSFFRRIYSWPRNFYIKWSTIFHIIVYEQKFLRKRIFFKNFYFYLFAILFSYLAISGLDEMKYHKDTLEPFNEWFYVIYDLGSDHFAVFFAVLLLFWFFSFFFVAMVYNTLSIWLTSYFLLTFFWELDFPHLTVNLHDMWAVHEIYSFAIVTCLGCFFWNDQCDREEAYDLFLHNAYSHPEVNKHFELGDISNIYPGYKNNLENYGSLEHNQSWETAHYAHLVDLYTKEGYPEGSELFQFEIETKLRDWKAFDLSLWESTRSYGKEYAKLRHDEFNEFHKDYLPLYQRIEWEVDEGIRKKEAERIKINRLRGYPDDF